MSIQIHPHALERMRERGAKEDEVRLTVEGGEKFPAKFDRTGFRRNFAFNTEWRGNFYTTKQVEVFAVKENEIWIIVTVITRYF